MPVMALVPRQSREYQETHLYQNQTHNLGAFYVVVVVVSAICMCMRLLSRLATRVGLGSDDWTFFAGSALAICSFIVLLIYSFDAGLGEHWVALTHEQKKLFAKLNYAYNILNLSCYPIIKLSILLFYLRIFPQTTFRKLCWAGVVFISCMCIANTLVAIFPCHPIAGFYDRALKPKCVDVVQFYWATAILNVVTDLYILILPIPLVLRLHTNPKRKLAILLIFMLGGLTFIVSIIRIVYYLDYTDSDPSYSFLGTAYATPAEVCLAVVVASAPTFRPLWRYTTQMAHSVFSRNGSSGKSFSLAAAHEEARSAVVMESKMTDKTEVTVQEEEMSCKSSTSRLHSHETPVSAGGPLQKSPSTAGSSSSSNDLIAAATRNGV